MVLTLGVMSCETTEVKPIDDSLSMADFTGTWNLESVTYKGITYGDCNDSAYRQAIDRNGSQEPTWTGISLEIDGVNSKFKWFDCDGTELSNGFWQDGVFDVNTMIVTFHDSFGNIKYEFLFKNVDGLLDVPKRFSFELITKPVDTHSAVLFVTHNLVNIIK